MENGEERVSRENIADMYNIDDKIKTLSEKLKSSVKDDSQFYVNPEIINGNTQWDASVLLTEILLDAQKEPKFTYKDLCQFHKEYEKENNLQIPLDSIIEKQWIRHINGEIRLPNAITKALWSFRKENAGKSIKFPKYIAENINEFRFLYELHNKVGYSDSRKILIENHQLQDVVEKHTNYFLQTPSSDELLAKLNIKSKNDKYEICIGHGNDYWHQFSNEISARLWERLLKENSNKSVEENFEEWLDKSVWCKNPCPYMSINDRRKSLDAVWNKLITEHDIEYPENEFAKIYWDNLHSHIIWNDDIILPSRYKIVNTSFTELYRSLNGIDNTFHDIVSHQEIREDISFLIRLIIENDKVPYTKIKELFKISLDKPFLFYETIQILNRKHVDIFPYLLREDDLFIIVFECLSEIKIADILLEGEKDYQEQNRQKYITKILMDCLNIYLSHAVNRRTDYNVIVGNIVEILHITAKNIFSSVNTNRYNSHLLEKEEYINRFHKISEFVLKFETTFEKDFFKNIYSEIYTCIEKIKRPISYHAVLHSFYFPKSYIISEFLRSDKLTDNNKKDLIRLFVNSFTEELQSDKIEVQHYWYDTKKMQDVSWSDQQYGYDLINWKEIVLYANKFLLLDDFLSSLKNNFKKTKINSEEINNGESEKEWQKEREWNRSQGYKLRLMLRILLLAYSEINKAKDYYQNLGFDVEGSLLLLQSKIIDIVIKNCKSDIEKGIYDIFSDSFESIFNTNTSLFSLLCETTNYFTNEGRKKLIDSLLKSNNAFEKGVELYNSLISEGERQSLKSKLENMSIKEYLDNATWLPQLENALIQSINSEIFTNQAEEIFKYYEKIVDKKNYQVEKEDFIYRIKLLLAYRHNDRQKLNAIVVPERKYHISTINQSAENLKTFYLSLFDLKDNDLDKAYKKLETLYKSEPQNTEYFIRKCYAKSLIVDNLNDILKRTNEYQSILDNIKKYSFPENQYYNRTLVDWIKLCSYSILDKNDSNFYNLYSQLHLSQQMDKNYLELAVDSLVKWHEYSKATDIIKQAKDFHISRNETYPDFLNDLEKKLGTDDNIKRLKRNFQNMLSLRFEDLLRIIPKRFNHSENDYREFIAFEIAFAFKSILDKINTIDKLKNEDSYTDMLEILFNARLSIFDKEITPSRGGHSETGKEIGRLDLKMNLGSNNITIEALRWNKNGFKLQEHITKTFNYDPSRVAFYNVVYYEKENFEQDWSEFKITHFANLVFPQEYSLIEPINDISSTFGHNLIKIAISKHEHNLVFFHILVNINYNN